MKTFSKTFLPETVEYNSQTYYLNIKISAAMTVNSTSPNIIQDTLKKEGRKAVLVKVMSRNLRGKTDLHGKPYQPTEWVFTNDKQS